MITLQINEAQKQIIERGLRVLGEEFRVAASQANNVFVRQLFQKDEDIINQLADQIGQAADTPVDIEQEVRRALLHGHVGAGMRPGLIAGIKRHRELTNQGLYQSKLFVEQLRDRMRQAGELD
jgi:hypothetical protein